MALYLIYNKQDNRIIADFYTEKELVSYVQLIAIEQEDEYTIHIETLADVSRFIDYYCQNLMLVTQVMYGVEKVDDDVTILLEDGGIVNMYNNGEHMISVYYQNRTLYPFMDGDMWNELNEGKSYIKDWEDKQSVDDEMTQDALRWLCPFADGFKEMDMAYMNKLFFKL